MRWARDVEGVSVVVEFLCETDLVEAGQHLPGPKQEFTGSRFSAFNVREARLAREEISSNVRLRANELDGGGHSKVIVRVANVLPYTVLKFLRVSGST